MAPHQKQVPRLALRVGEAAKALGVSEDAFFEHIAPELPVVRRGRMKLYAIRDIERWLDANASRTLPAEFSIYPEDDLA